MSGSDAIGQIGDGIPRFLDPIKTSMSRFSDLTSNLDQTSNQLADTTIVLGSVAEDTTIKATNSASASKEMHANMPSLGAASEEMAATLKDVARTTHSATKIAQESVISKARVKSAIDKLSVNSQDSRRSW